MTPPLPNIGIRNGSDTDQVGCVLEESLTLGQRLVDEADLALLEVAQAAVDQLRRLGGGSRREVVTFDQRGLHAPRGRVEHHAGAGDAAADHHEVERLGAQGVERRGAHERSRRRTREGACGHAATLKGRSDRRTSVLSQSSLHLVPRRNTAALLMGRLDEQASFLGLSARLLGGSPDRWSRCGSPVDHREYPFSTTLSVESVSELTSDLLARREARETLRSHDH